MSKVLGFEEVKGWESAWKAHERDPEDLRERDKRYGRIFDVFDEDKLFVVRIALPQKTPNHPWLYQYDLPKRLSPYKVEAFVKDNVLAMYGFMQDESLKKVCGLINSFPDRFSTKLPIEFEAGEINIHYIDPYLVDVKVAKRQDAL